MFATISEQTSNSSLRQLSVYLSKDVDLGKVFQIGLRFTANASSLTILVPPCGPTFPVIQRGSSARHAFLIPRRARPYVKLGRFEIERCPDGWKVDFAKPVEATKESPRRPPKASTARR